MSLVIKLAAFALFAANSSALFQCPQDYCNGVECEEVRNCTGPNQKIQRGTFCNCCDVCYTTLMENEACNGLLFLGMEPPTEGCHENFTCYLSKCQKVETVIKLEQEQGNKNE